MNAGRLIEIRADLLMDLALKIGCVAELFDRVSKSLHEQAMRDLASAIVHELEDIDGAGDEAVPQVSHFGSGTAASDHTEFSTSFAELENRPVQRDGTDRPPTPAEAAAALGAALRSEYGESSCSRSFEREHEQEQRPDRGWQRLGDVTNQVVKAAVVTGAIRGHIPRPVASEIVASKTLRDA